MMLRQACLPLLAGLSLWPALAIAQNHLPQPVVTPQVDEAVRLFVANHPSMSGRTFTIRWRDKPPTLPPCPTKLQLSLVRKDRPWGQVYMQVECQQAPQTWRKTIQIHVAVPGKAWAAKKSLKPGEIVNSSYFEAIELDLSKYQGELIEDPAELEGMEVARPLPAGVAVKLNDFKSATVIKSGDLIKLTLLGQGFEMITSGQALSDAVIGATVRVRTVEGKTLQGKAVAAGRVEAVLD